MQNEEVVLEARHIKTCFPVKNTGGLGRPRQMLKAVDDVSLTLHKGETFGLVGETGCGKSTLGRTVLRLLEPEAGQILLNGQDITHLKERQMIPFRRKMQMVFQDPYTSLDPRQKVGDILMEALAIQHIGSAGTRMDLAMSMLEKVGLRPQHFYRYPHEFSGGQRQRVGLARALILDPSFVVCDEPVSALDVSVQSQIINLLLDLQKDGDVTYLFISHDMSVVKYVSVRVAVMYLGHIVEEAATDELFSMAAHPYSQALLSSVPSSNPKIKKDRIVLEGEIPSPIHAPQGCVFHTRCMYSMPICSQQAPEMKEISCGHCVACHLFDK